MEYAHRNLLEIKNRSQLLEELLKDYPYFDPQHVTSKLNNQKLSHIQKQQKMQLFQNHSNTNSIHTFP